jgi:hypothetical protein
MPGNPLSDRIVDDHRSTTRDRPRRVLDVCRYHRCLSGAHDARGIAHNDLEIAINDVPHLLI